MKLPYVLFNLTALAVTALPAHTQPQSRPITIVEGSGWAEEPLRGDALQAATNSARGALQGSCIGDVLYDTVRQKEFNCDKLVDSEGRLSYSCTVTVTAKCVEVA